MKPKNLLYILIALAIVAVLAFVIYQLVYSVNNNAPGGAGQTGSLPAVTGQQFPTGNQSGNKTSGVGAFNAGGANASSSKFGIISNDPALDYFVDAANVVTLMKPDGTIESISNGQASVLSNSAVLNIITSAFSYDGKKVLVTYTRRDYDSIKRVRSRHAEHGPIFPTAYKAPSGHPSTIKWHILSHQTPDRKRSQRSTQEPRWQSQQLLLRSIWKIWLSSGPIRTSSFFPIVRAPIRRGRSGFLLFPQKYFLRRSMRVLGQKVYGVLPVRR